MKYYLVILVKDYYDMVETRWLVYDEYGREPFFSSDRKASEKFITQMRELNPKASYKLVEVDI
jgi:hypothetical protein